MKPHRWKRQRRRSFWPAAAVLGVLAAAIVLPAADDAELEAFQDRLVPVVRVIAFGDGIGRLDTRTGEVLEFEGNLRNPSVRSYWDEKVAGVAVRPPGTLRLQQARGETFLVDVVEGTTWLLRRRGDRYDWQPVPVVDN